MKPSILLSKSSFRNILYNLNQVRLNHEWVVPRGHDTGIKIRNRVKKNKVPLIFPNKNFVKWYICGPTVYDVAHIGHASCYVRFDIIRRILEQFFDIRPVIALGITDIDDKIINKAIKTNIDYKILAKQYELEFLKELGELNILPPSFILRVSDHIPEIIEYVSKILEQGKAYTAKDGSVYFDTTAYGHYGKLVPCQAEGSSPLKKEQKHFLDFALWKGAKPNEPFWETPWGKGRPGWHIECSAMASKIFGSPLDLHSGGIDLVFPHHENEEAQSCCYHNCDQWVNYWMHSGSLMVKEEKMSKSLQNYTSISDFLKTYTSDNLRMFCFMSQYRKGLHYGSDSMSLSVSTCNKISEFLGDSGSYIKGNWSKGNVCESTLLKELDQTTRKVKECLLDDFDTGGCLISLMELIRTTVKMLNEETVSASRSPSAVAAVSLYISQIFNDFGFQLGSSGMLHESSAQNKIEFILNTSVDFRSQVRKEALCSKEKPLKQNLLKACDSFRDELGQVGVIVKDQGKDTSSWSLMDITDTVKESETIKAESKS